LIRLKYDPQGLILLEKLGGWARFFANQITGVIRSLCAWQDLDINKWLAYGAVSPNTALVAINCATVNGTTTGQIATDITPYYGSTSSTIIFNPQSYVAQDTVADPTIFAVTDNIVGFTVSQFDTVNVTTPVSAAGVIFFGMYKIKAINSTNIYQIVATNVLQQPIPAQFITVKNSITGITFSSPNMTISFSTFAGYTFTPNDYVLVTGALPVILNGAYPVISSTSSTVTVAAPSGASTYSSGGYVSNEGMVPQLTTVSGSSIVTVFFPDHGYSPGSTFSILNGTTIGGIYFSGQYDILYILNSYSFTFYAPTVATASETNSLNARAVINAGLVASTITLTCDVSALSPFPSNPLFAVGDTIVVSGITPSNWNGTFIVISSSTVNVSFVNSSATGTWVSGGSVAHVGGDVAYVYNINVGTRSTGSPYGQGVYGNGVYNGAGSSQTIPGTEISATNWELDNWGGDLLALPVGFSPLPYENGSFYQQAIYIWNPIGGQALAKIIPGSPPTSGGFFVAMPQRQIVAWASSFNGVIDPLLLRWCDVNNYNVWVAQTANQAGSFRLSSGSRIVGAIQGPQQGFVWTDVSLWTMQYSGPPYVYNINLVATGCGLIGRHARAILSGVTYWMGREQFFAISGSGVSPLPCPVWDVVFQQLDLANVEKITASANSLFGEITWYYPIVGGNGEVSNYIRFNTMLNQWDFGVLARSAWLDTSVIGPPIGADPVNEYIYQHEISPDADGKAMTPIFRTGWFALEDGNHKTFIDEWWSDIKFGYYGKSQNSTVSLTIYGADFPEQTPVPYGPFTLTENTTFFSPRVRARLLALEFSSNDLGSFWRVGLNRYRYQPDGKY